MRHRDETSAASVTPKHQNSVSFILRLWREDLEVPRGGDEWRGCVEAVETEEKMYFDNLSDFCKFLELELHKLGANA
jgi:hypothetical protein